MKIFFYLIFLSSCSNGNLYTVSRIVDGNTVELSNGETVQLDGVQKIDENIKILEHYAKGSIHLYDQNNDEIIKFSSDKISAVIYNSEGDCVNDLLKRVTEITKNEIPKTQDNTPSENKTIIKMRSENGVYTIPVEINGVIMYFIFDTGASLISISSTEATDLLRQGKLPQNDIVGKGIFSDANGDISEGTIIILSKVKIGNRILTDVQACVIANQNAPLLLGQSALERFGKISIDYKREEITFE